MISRNKHLDTLKSLILNFRIMIELNILEINENVDLEIVGTFFTYEANEYCSKAQIIIFEQRRLHSMEFKYLQF